MRPLVIRSVAEAELANAISWYAERSPDTAKRLIGSIDRTLCQIGDAPTSFTLIGMTVRRALVEHFPYAVYFVILPEVTAVLGFAHGRKQRWRWQLREELASYPVAAA